MLITNTSTVPGRLVVFTGGDGSGKSTAIDRLKQDFPEPATVYTREPGGTDIGRLIRTILVDQPDKPLPRAQWHLFMADRCQLAEEFTWPALQRGQLVISDRGPEGTFAYQEYAQLGRRDVRSFMQRLEEDHIPIPHAFVWFRLDPKIGLERRSKSGEMNAFDREQLDFHQRVAEGYELFMQEVQPFSQVFTIDGSQSPDVVYDRVHDVIRTHFLRHA